MTIKVKRPEVYVIAHSMIIGGETDAFLQSEGASEDVDIHRRLFEELEELDSDTIPELAGRICYGSYGRKKDTNARYVGHIIEVGHGSVLEHSTVTLAIKGVSRSLTHELIRHRAGFGYSQRSQRFVDEGDLEIVIPPLYNTDGWEGMSELVQEAAEKSQEYYNKLVEEGMNRLAEIDNLINMCVREGIIKGGDRYCIEAKHKDIPSYMNDSYYELGSLKAILDSDKGAPVRKALLNLSLTARRKTAREAARSVLPNCTETRLFVTGNLRAWRGMIDQRANIHADREIRQLAVTILTVLKKLAPNVFNDYEIKEDNQGVLYASTPNPKV